MDEAALERALQAGTDCVADEVATRGAKVVAIGEVGIGNTTTAAALLCALTGADAAACCGRGTGLDDAGLEHRGGHGARRVRRAAPELARVAPAADSALVARAALRLLGGYELAAMCGAYIEAARLGVAAVVDGFISGVAALCAARIAPACRTAMVFATSLAEEPSIDARRRDPRRRARRAPRALDGPAPGRGERRHARAAAAAPRRRSSGGAGRWKRRWRWGIELD